MFCVKCGGEIDNTAKFCTHCGCRVDESVRRTFTQAEASGDNVLRENHIKSGLPEAHNAAEEAAAGEKPEAKAEIKAEVKNEVKAEVKNEVKTEAKTDNNKGNKTVSGRVERRAYHKSYDGEEAKADIKADTKAHGIDDKSNPVSVGDRTYAGSSHSQNTAYSQPAKRSKAPLIILIIVLGTILALGIVGFIFRDTITEKIDEFRYGVEYYDDSDMSDEYTDDTDEYYVEDTDDGYYDESEDEYYEGEEEEDNGELSADDGTETSGLGLGDTLMDDNDDADTADEEIPDSDDEVLDDSEEEVSSGEEVNDDPVTNPYGLNGNCEIIKDDEGIIRYRNIDSGYIFALEQNVAASRQLDDDSVRELLNNMLPLSDYGNAAIVIYDQGGSISTIDDFSQDYMDENYPNASDTFILLSEINTSDGSMNYGVYVGGDFSGLIPDRKSFAKFNSSIGDYDSVAYGFLKTTEEFMQDKGYTLREVSDEPDMSDSEDDTE